MSSMCCCKYFFLQLKISFHTLTYKAEVKNWESLIWVAMTTKELLESTMFVNKHLSLKTYYYTTLYNCYRFNVIKVRVFFRKFKTLHFSSQFSNQSPNRKMFARTWQSRSATTRSTMLPAATSSAERLSNLWYDFVGQFTSASALRDVLW